MKIDILAFGAHPDDVELSASGTMAKHQKLGYTTGIIDLTRGELGTRGSAEIRDREAKNAAEILKLSIRENLEMADGFFEITQENLLKIVQKIRQYQPDIVLCNAFQDRHPDHGRGSELVSRACFLSGLLKIETQIDQKNQKPWRPKAVYHYIQYQDRKPDFVVDISDSIQEKMQSIMAYESQFYQAGTDEPDTPISSKQFLNSVEARTENWGKDIGVKNAEAFEIERFIGVSNLFDLN
ncbi:MAG: bacillithiol biosynthesis deacetylase BshB1 [Flavobacteriales bacterium]|jgi:bacillithiol biosynthesis deacetylase BshB1|nr:bacillithiol biosynthesis deacetylase BshB1 [Flavobacteriales bacterium]